MSVGVDIAHQLVGSLKLLGCLEELVVAHRHQTAYLALHEPHVADSLYHVARTGFALGAYHRGTLGNAPQGLAKVSRTAYKGHVELGLVDMEDVVGRRQHLALVDIVNLNGLQYLCFGNVSDAAFGHHGNAHGLLYAAYHLGITHARHTSGGPDVGRYPFQSHHGARSSLLGYARLLGCCHIHNHSALEHLCQLAVKLLSFV